MVMYVGLLVMAMIPGIGGKKGRGTGQVHLYGYLSLMHDEHGDPFSPRKRNTLQFSSQA